MKSKIMANMSDYLLDRLSLKSKLLFWRMIALVILTLLILYTIFDLSNKPSSTLQSPFIARISLTGEIVEDRKREQILNKLAKNDKVQAVILHLNTPGGTAYGGESLFYSIRKIASKKPVVAIVGTCAASGGYMSAIAADVIFARNTSIVGSIGTIIITEEISELSKKLGVEFIVYKSGDLKAEPLFTHKPSEKVKEITMQSVMDSYNIFVDMVIDRRKLSKNEVLPLADGRIFTGHQALQNKLIDAIGGEGEAVIWLEDHKNIAKDINIKDISLQDKEEMFSKFIAPLNKINMTFDHVINFLKPVQTSWMIK